MSAFYKQPRRADQLVTTPALNAGTASPVTPVPNNGSDDNAPTSSSGVHRPTRLDPYCGWVKNAGRGNEDLGECYKSSQAHTGLTLLQKFFGHVSCVIRLKIVSSLPSSTT